MLEGDENPEGIENYPLDDLLIRSEARTIQDILYRIDAKRIVLDPEFQRAFVWTEKEQSKLIESVLMRIPLPVFYFAENENGDLVVVDGVPPRRLPGTTTIGDARKKLDDVDRGLCDCFFDYPGIPVDESVAFSHDDEAAHGLSYAHQEGSLAVSVASKSTRWICCW